MDGSTVSTPTLEHELTLTLDPVEVTPCEAEAHAESTDGHVPAQTASYIVRMPCGYTYACCFGRVQRYRETQNNVRKRTTVHCPSCGLHHDVREVTWTDLP